MTESIAPAQLTGDGIRRLLDLLGAVDSVELKLTVAEAQHVAVVRALGLDPLDAQIRQVYFFDTPDLRLSGSGVVLRARRVQGKGDDTVVKLRPLDPDGLSPEVRKSSAFGIELDAMPGGAYVCSGSLRGVATDVRGTVLRGGPLRKLFTKEQRALFAAHAPDGAAIDDLAILGPTFVLKVKFEPEVLGRRLVAEYWLYPDGSRIFELSTKCLPSEAFQVAVETRAYLAERGIDVGGEQQTKTRKALEFFSGQARSASVRG
jgi:hypothetical protein